MTRTVEVEKLTKRFGDFTAVDSVSFSVDRGEIFGFLGPNGAGKSTTIKMLCGLVVPTEGSGHVAGFDIASEQDRIKTVIGYMSQKFSLYEDLTVLENLEFFGSIYNIDKSVLAERSERVLKMAEIGGDRNILVRSLPAGVKQRLALGGAILHDPPVLFLDEPTSGVDPVMRRNFWDLIHRFSEEGKTVFVTTHYLDEAEHCGRIALIISGKLIALDPPEKLKDELPFSLYSLSTDKFISLFDRISGLPFIIEASIFGSEIHLLCDKSVSAEELDRKLRTSLGADKPDYKLEQIRPTLEDVFVTSVREHMDIQT
jgi:ABC-2 type transport system ATP-binding protein